MERANSVKEVAVRKTLDFLTELYESEKGFSGSQLIELHKKHKISNSTSSICKKSKLIVAENGLFVYQWIKPTRETAIHVIELLRESTAKKSSYTPNQREYFAGKALQGLTSNCLNENVIGWDVNSLVEEALKFADAIIMKLNN